MVRATHLVIVGNKAPVDVSRATHVTRHAILPSSPTNSQSPDYLQPPTAAATAAAADTPGSWT